MTSSGTPHLMRQSEGAAAPQTRSAQRSGPRSSRSSPSSQASKQPQRRRYQRPARSRWRRYGLYAALGVGALVVALVVVAFVTTGGRPLRIVAGIARGARSAGLPVPKGKTANGKNAQRQALAQARPAILAATAASLHLTSVQLTADLDAGQTIPQIAQAQHTPLSQVNAAYLNAVKTQLNDAVQQGKITQSQASSLEQTVQNDVAKGKYPLLGQGGSALGVRDTRTYTGVGNR